MSSTEHHATVDKGLKMKIKRKNVNVEKPDTKPKKDQSKPDTVKGDIKLQGETSQSANGMLADKTSKLSLFTDKERSPKSKQALSKKEKGKGGNKGDCGNVVGGAAFNGVADSLYGQANMEPNLGETATGKKECIPDPYEFNAKVEDGISMPIKKIKLEKEKVEPQVNAMTSPQISAASTYKDAATDSHDVGVVTEPDCLGPCEPGTQVTLAGIVWHESDNGVLVVNVTWRGKTYVGTLLDATRHDWAPPRFNCDSPTSEFESRTPKGRGKRRGASNTPVNDTRTLRKGRRGSNVQPFTAPPSPAKSDISSGGIKRKGRPQDIDLSAAEQRSTKRSRSGSQAPTPNSETPPTDAQGFIECPEPNCNKKYRHANGLKYHQSHAHSGLCQSFEDAKEMDTEDVPLSVVKNSAKKDRDNKQRENNANKKDSVKESSDKNESAALKKTDKEDSVEDDSKDNKSEAKCDNLNSSSKRKDSANSNSFSKLTVTTTAQHSTSSNKSFVSQNSGMKANQSSLVSHGHGPSQLFSTNSSTGHPSSQPSSLTSSALTNTVSLTSTTISSTVAQSETFKADNKLVDIKPKITSDVRVSKPNRPIVPAPTPQVLANVQVTHSNLTPVMSHTQMSPQLKPIQPKPTIMGEPQNINPALADFNKDRKKVQKKKPLKDGQQVASGRPDQPTIKIERSGVIKTNPLPSTKQGDQTKKDILTKDVSKHGSDSHRSQNIASHSGKSLDIPHSRMNPNPNLLKVGSPLQVATPDNGKTPVNDDVQSPAYSDISDANESSASPAAPSDTSPQKQKDDSNMTNKKEEKSEPSPQQQNDNPMVSHYGMYSYYGQQSPFGMSNPNMSPGQKSNSSISSGPSQQASNMNKEVKNLSSESKKPSSEEHMKDDKKAEEDKSNRPKGIPLQSPGGPLHNMSPQQMHDYQNWYAQQMYIQSLPPPMQYQYMANGWRPPMDPVTIQMMEEQRRAQASGEPGRNDREGGPNRPHGQEGHPSGSTGRGPGDQKGIPSSMMGRKDDGVHGQKPMPSPNGNQSGSERTDNTNKSSDDKNMKDIALREKQNENHQILKENIDLKIEMDKNRQEIERYRQDEIRRYKMYHEQKMIEEKKKMELARKAEGRAENPGGKAPGTRPIIEHGPRSLIQGHRPDDLHRDNNNVKNMDSKVKESHSRESSANRHSETSKPGDEKSKTPVPDKHRSETPQRNPDNLSKRPSGSSSKSGSPSTSISSSSVPGSPSFPSYVSNYQYMQNHQFMGIDQSHPLYRAHVNPALMSGYPGYIHPSQMGFRPGSDEDKEKLSAQKTAQPPSSDSDPKKEVSNRGGPFYGNVHKIHELSEKGRPRSRNSSPGPVKPTDTVTSSYDKHRDYTNSPPTQRHVHTHHHTHVLQPGIPQPALQHPPGFFDHYGDGEKEPICYTDTCTAAMFVSQAQSPHPFPPK